MPWPMRWGGKWSKKLNRNIQLLGPREFNIVSEQVLTGSPENLRNGWLGHSATVPQMAQDWGFAALSRQPHPVYNRVLDQATFAQTHPFIMSLHATRVHYSSISPPSSSPPEQRRNLNETPGNALLLHVLSRESATVSRGRLCGVCRRDESAEHR